MKSNAMNLLLSRYNFKFNFFTNGPNRYNDIAIDLLPHALSLLIELLGDLEIKDIAIESVELVDFAVALNGTTVNSICARHPKFQKNYRLALTAGNTGGPKKQ